MGLWRGCILNQIARAQIRKNLKDTKKGNKVKKHYK